MTVQVKISTTLRKYVPAYDPEKALHIDVPEAASIGDLAAQLGIPAEKIKFVMLNGRALPLETALADGDRVAFFPPVGGG